MVDVFAVADIIVKHIKTHYPRDVAIVGYYGSYLQGRATDRSDLDFFFIPATTRGRQVECQFIIDGISFDFWPIGWDRAERMATSEEWSTTIIAFRSLGFLNQIYYKRSWGHYREQVRNLPIKPDQLDQYLDIIMFSPIPDEIISAG